MKPVHKRIAAMLVGLLFLLVCGVAQAARESNIRATKHNLSAAADGSTPNNPPHPGTSAQVPTRTVKASTETQVCVFCHTPHASTSGATPLWNRALNTTVNAYTVYTSNSLDANAIQTALEQPGGSSKLCLSCHDGTLGIGQVNVLNGAGSVTTPGTVPITMLGTVAGKMPDGSTDNTGFTRKLGTDLRNDHPISVTYNKTLTDRDGELRAVDATTQKDTKTTGTLIGVRGIGYKPKMPLESTGPSTDKGQVQCATCHDPHIRETDTTQGNQKFLRLNRFQTNNSGATAAAVADFNSANDIICLACHDKNGSSGSWSFSAHANDQVAQQTYTSSASAATLRDFPANLPVWRASCLNCHDTHTVPGARRLLREGTNGPGTPKVGGDSAIEETCYQCHTTTGTVLQTGGTGALAEVPDIKTDFTTLAIRMPITGTETHNIGSDFDDGGNANCITTPAKCGADFLESKAVLTSRHAECTDCHNPHRVIKAKNGLPGPLSPSNTNDASGTHKHTNDNADIHTNNISGVLRGSWGVEPSYTNNSFHLSAANAPALDAALTFTVKRGDPGSNPAPADGTRPGAETYVTREYQICLKCHSNYAYPDDNVYPNAGLGNRPMLGTTGLTAQNANGHANFTTYTNQAKEFQAPLSHAKTNGSVSLGIDGGTGPYVSATNNPRDNNNRSWHPVMAPTGRLNRAGGFLPPWNQGTGGKAGRLGVQTMYCSDCHGSATGAATAIPNNGENGSPWGPHGSSNNFLLKGDYSTSTGEGQESTGLCFKCHSYSDYATAANRGSNGATGFRTDDSEGDGHALHANRIGSAMKCNWCHVAVPHGWKNRSLLVNLNDVGPEDGRTAGTSVSYTAEVGYTNGPYYRKAFLRIRSFPASGTDWSLSNCMGGTINSMQNNCDAPN